VNRTLSPRDRRNRSGTARRESRYRWLDPGACGLERGVAHPAKRKTPPGVNPAARGERASDSAFDGVSSLAILALGGDDGQAHLLRDRPGQKAANRMRLPAGSLHQLLGRCAVRAFQPLQDFGSLAAISRTLAFYRALGRFLSRGGLLPRLGLLRRDRARTFGAGGLLGGFRRLGGGAKAISIASAVEIIAFSPLLAGFPHHINRSGRQDKQGNSAMNRGWRMAGDCASLAYRWQQMAPHGRTRRKTRS